MKYKFIRNKEEYIEFLETLRDNFDCEEDFEDFFGIELAWNEETGEILEELKDYKGIIRLVPKEFPSILVYDFDVLEDCRSGDIQLKIFDWLTMNEIRNLAQYSSY